jgi:hypothetical protein
MRREGERGNGFLLTTGFVVRGGYDMGVHLTEAAMIAYAHERAHHGRQLLDEHVPDPTGCCRQCGRTHPCPERRYGGDLLVHFDHWWSSPTTQPRPYAVDSKPDYPA